MVESAWDKAAVLGSILNISTDQQPTCRGKTKSACCAVTVEIIHNWTSWSCHLVDWTLYMYCAIGGVAEHGYCYKFVIECLSHQGGVNKTANYLFEYQQKL